MGSRVFGVRGLAFAGLMLALPVLAAGPLPLVTSAKAESEGADLMRLLRSKKKPGSAAAPASISNANDHGVAVSGTKSTTETEIVAGQNVQPMLSADSATRMADIATRYRNIVANGDFPKVPRGTYKKGSTSKGVVALNQRLYMDGYLRQEATQGEFAGIYTSATEDAVARFQRNMGLAVTGKVDNATLEQLNVPASVRLRAIEANIPRLQVYSQGLGDRYLVVNVPAQQIETVSGGTVYSRHNAIVGRPARPTPVVMAALSDVNFNPYWNAPASIVEKDIIPKMVSGTKILEDMNIKVFKGVGGPEIDPNSVNWRSAIADDYHFRQEPGPGNAMATAKINFPSPFGIYLHDTPERQLFRTGNRFYSSGCVRVEQMGKLLEWVLNGQDGIDSSQISALAETLERRDVKLASPPQLRVAYLTAWPVGDTVAFRNDIYQLDGTGFTVGQPLPVGEMSAEGQRFVLKPVPRQAGAVEDAEAEGFGLFGFRRSTAKKPAAGAAAPASPFVFNAPKRKPLVEQPADDAAGDTVATPVKKPATQAKAADKKTAKGKKDAPGLFDWASYRKEQKQGTVKPAKLAKKKPDAKKPDLKKPATAKAEDVAAAKAPDAPKATVKPGAKPAAKPDAVVAKADPKQQVPAKKPAADAAAAAKKPADASKAAAATPKPAAKKPAPKKDAAACKPDATGKAPADCAAN